MTSSARIACVPVASLVAADARTWREKVKGACVAGSRLVTLFGRAHGKEVVVTAVFEDSSGRYVVERGVLDQEIGYHELTSEFPALHCFERELHEQTGVRVAGHPWLKPIRYEGRGADAMASHAYWRLEGKEVHEVAVGPVHAGVIEPGAFRFQCLGEQVHHLEIQLGYQHRGVERRLLELDPLRAAPLIETIAGDTSIAHVWAHCAAIEALAGVELPLGIDFARGIVLELERVAMHLAALSGLATDIALLQGATTYGRLRTTVINTTMRLCGSRFGRGALRPGGVRLETDESGVRDLLANVRLVQNDIALVDELFSSARTVQHRLRGVGVLTGQAARELGIVGHAARASGLPIDARQGVTEGACAELRLPLVTAPTGDCHARADVRIREIRASLAWILEAARRCPAPTPRLPLGPLAPSSLVVAVVEGWRGEVVHCLETDARGALLHHKVQDPSLRNWMALAFAMRGTEISDFPICNKSFDLSYCGNDL